MKVPKGKSNATWKARKGITVFWLIQSSIQRLTDGRLHPRDSELVARARYLIPILWGGTGLARSASSIRSLLPRLETAPSSRAELHSGGVFSLLHKACVDPQSHHLPVPDPATPRASGDGTVPGLGGTISTFTVVVFAQSKRWLRLFSTCPTPGLLASIRRIRASRLTLGRAGHKSPI